MTSPFVVGSRVAIISGYAKDLSAPKEGFVSKVYKNGNFRIEGDDRQFRPTVSARGASAYPTGEESRTRFSARVWLWDDAFEDEVQKAKTERARILRCYSIMPRLNRIYQFLNHEELALIEKALATYEERISPKEHSDDRGPSNDTTSDDPAG